MNAPEMADGGDKGRRHNQGIIKASKAMPQKKPQQNMTEQ
jgi:hypothetical protein